MKFKLTNIISALSLVLATSVYAEIEQTEQTHQLGRFVDDNSTNVPFRTNVENEERLTAYDVNNGTRKHLSNEYFIILEDQPLASYQGGIDDLPATNVFASKGDNATETGKLDTKSFASKRYKNYLAAKQDETQFHINSRLKREIEVGSTFKIALNGFTATLSPSEAVLVSQLPNVIAVGKAGIAKISTDSGPKYSGADKVWQGSSNHIGTKGEGMVIGVIDSGIASFVEPVDNINDLDNLPDFHPSFAAEVDEDGDGVIDYVHQNPKGQYYGDCVASPGWCNDKLIGIVPFGHIKKHLIFRRNEENTFLREVDDARSETGQDSNGHGTHVASTAAGNPVYKVKTEGIIGGALPEIYQHDFVYEKITGVAPRANIIAYKACDSGGYCYQQYAISAIEHAIEVGVDVLNYSVGSTPNTPWYDWVSLAYLNAREAGIHVAASAGNSGANGKASMRTPGNAPWLMGIAAINHDRAFQSKSMTLIGGSDDFEMDSNIIEGEGATMGLAATDVVLASDVEYATAVGDFEISGACGIDSIPADAVAGKIVVCNRGGVSVDGPLSRAVKSHNLSLVGAAGMILINTSDTGDNVVADFHTIPSIHIDRKKGKLLLDWLSEGEGHQVSIEAAQLISSQTLDEDKDLSGLVTYFSSQGPDRFSGDYLVPSIAAPGQDILAGGLGYNQTEFTLNQDSVSDKDFMYRSGTSMAAPHVAGMMLLLKSIHPEWSAAELQSAIMLTAGTNAKVVGPVVRKKQTWDPAPLHSSGAGIARVDLAAETGLIMHETVAGYLAADPFGDIAAVQMPTEPGHEEINDDEEIRNIRDLVKELPPGWHGEPSKMNIPSMSKGGCIEECQWTRTFKATKDAEWTVSYSYTTEGMTLSSDREQPFVVRAGEEFNITVKATADVDINTDWSDGRVHLTSTDPSIPAVSIPVTVNFIVGSAPELLEINTHRDVGSVELEDVVSIGTNDLTIQTSILTEGIEYNVSLKRSSLPDYIKEEMDVSSYFMPVSIPAGTDRFVVEILETSSPDIDIFMAEDMNANGAPDTYEWNRIYFHATTPTHLEKMDYPLPRKGDYWLMIHNYGNQFNNEDREEFDPEQAAIVDTVKFVVSRVKDEYDAKGEDTRDGSLKVTAPKVNYKNSDIPVVVSFDKEMKEKTKYYGAMVIGSTEDLVGNMGWVNIDLYRDQDDVKLSLLDRSEGLASYNIRFMANRSENEQTYQMTMELPVSASFESMQISADSKNNADGTNGQDFSYEEADGVYTWEYSQQPNAGAETVTVVFDYSEVEGYSDITPYVTSQLNDEEEAQVAKAMPEMVKGKPVFLVEASDSVVEEGELVTLTASIVDSVIENAPITYDWQQVSGPEVVVTNNESSISFNAVKSKDGISFRLVANNSERNSAPITTTILVESEETGSGGSTDGLWFMLALLTLLSRRNSAQK